MTRMILSATAALLLSTGLGLAGGLVPGSDAGTKFDDGRADRSVVTGEAASRPAAGRSDAATTFGYPAARGNPAGAEAQPSAKPPRAVETRGALVPGSDSF